MCNLCNYRWIHKAFAVVVCSKSSEPSFPEIIYTFLRCWISSSTCNFSKERPTDMWQVMSDTVQDYCCLLSGYYGTSRLQSESFLHKTYWCYQRQPQCTWQLKSSSFECSILNCHKFNNSFVLKEGLLACKNFDFMKMHRSGCTLDAVHFTSMATGQNRFSVVEELSSRAFCKIAAPVLLR